MAAITTLVAVSGCVHRQFTVTTDPPGALVQVNGKTVGATPIDVPYDYYGTYRLNIVRDGYERLVVNQPVPTPWYEYFPLDFVSEQLVPFTIRDHRRFHYTLQPLQVVPPEAILGRSEQFRIKGRSVGAPVTSGPIVDPNSVPQINQGPGNQPPIINPVPQANPQVPPQSNNTGNPQLNNSSDPLFRIPTDTQINP